MTEPEILIVVDDRPMDVKALKDALKYEGLSDEFSVIAGVPEEEHKYVEGSVRQISLGLAEHGPRVAAILLDLSFEEPTSRDGGLWGGLRIAKKLRAQWPTVPIIAFTALPASSLDLRELTFSDALDGVLPKRWVLGEEFTADEFRRCIRMARERRGELPPRDETSASVGSATRIVVAAARADELSTLERELGTEDRWEEQGGMTWRLGTLRGQRVALLAAGEMGLVAGAKLASAGVRLFDAKTLVLVGTCAGRAAKGVKCGDVAIPAACFNYQFGEFKEGRFLRRLAMERVSVSLHAAVVSLLGRTGSLGACFQRCKGASMTVPKKAPEVHVEPMGSADLVVKDEAKLEDVRQADESARTLDMESFGFVSAGAMEGRSVLVVKGVSDLAGRKNDRFREFAKVAAAETVLAAIEAGLFR